jgi:hypothetical protein
LNSCEIPFFNKARSVNNESFLFTLLLPMLSPSKSLEEEEEEEEEEEVVDVE